MDKKVEKTDKNVDKKRHPLVGKFLVIEDERLGKQDHVKGTIIATCSSMTEAYDAIRGIALRDFKIRNDMSAPLEDWGSMMYICEVRQVVRPVPVVDIKIKLDNA